MSNRTWACVSFAACGFVIAAIVSAAAPGTAEIVSLQITKKMSQEQQHIVMIGQSGVTLTLVVSQPDKFVIGVDEHASKLTSFSDDKKTDLAKKEGFGSPDWLGGFFSKVSEDGKLVSIPIRSGVTPADGAREISLKATISLLCGADEKTVEQKDVALTDGTKLTIGPVPLTVGKVTGGGGFGNSGTKISVPLKTTQPVDAIKSVEFLNADGKVIKSHVNGRSSSGIGNMVSNETTYGLDEKVEKATIRITYYNKVEKASVPIDLKVGVGF